MLGLIIDKIGQRMRRQGVENQKTKCQSHSRSSQWKIKIISRFVISYQVDVAVSSLPSSSIILVVYTDHFVSNYFLCTACWMNFEKCAFIALSCLEKGKVRRLKRRGTRGKGGVIKGRGRRKREGVAGPKWKFWIRRCYFQCFVMTLNVCSMKIKKILM